MAMWYKPMELKSAPGTYRVCGVSDEDDSVFIETCTCDPAHKSKGSASNCGESLKMLDPLFRPGQHTDKVRAARASHEANKAYCESIGDTSQPSWDDAPDWQTASALNGVEFVLNNPYASSSSSHNSWLAEKERDGWVYGPVKDADKKTHPCFVPYSDLPKEQQFKDALFQAVVRGVLGL